MQWAQDRGQASSGMGVGIDPRTVGVSRAEGGSRGSSTEKSASSKAGSWGAGGNYLAF